MIRRWDRDTFRLIGAGAHGSFLGSGRVLMESLAKALLKTDHFIARKRQEERGYFGVGQDSERHFDLWNMLETMKPGLRRCMYILTVYPMYIIMHRLKLRHKGRAASKPHLVIHRIIIDHLVCVSIE